MSKKNKPKNNNIILLIIFFLFIFGVVLYLAVNINKTFTPKSNISINKWGGMKTFQSKDLKFSIKVPQNFSIKSSNTGIDLMRPEGSIEIVRNGTQFISLSEYLSEFDNIRDIKIKTSENINITGYIATRREEERVIGGVIKNLKAYYVWIDGIVYILSTASGSLFADLDQIAQSFKYNP